jgi:hypothetical protein
MSYTNDNQASFTRSVTDNSGTPVYPTGTHHGSGNTFSNAASNAVHNITDPITNATGFNNPNTTGSGFDNSYNNTTGLGSGLGHNTGDTTGLTGGLGHHTGNTAGLTGGLGHHTGNTAGLTGGLGHTGNTTGLGGNTTGFDHNTSSALPLAADKFKNSVFQVGPAGTSNIIASLERDHAEFRRLYNDFVQSGSMREREEIKNELIRGLSIHDFITETVLYPAASKEIPHGPEMISPFKTRMTDFRKMLMTIDKTKIDDPTFLPTFHTMFQELDTSMKQKELELLPALTRALTPKQIEELGRTLDKARSGAPTRPHTSAASSNVLGHLAAPIDKLKDKARDFAGASSETRDVLGK